MTEPDRTPLAEAVGLAEATRFQRDLYLYWHAVRVAGGLPLTTRGYLTRPALRLIRGRLAAPDGQQPNGDEEAGEGADARLFFVRRLLERLGLLRRAAGDARLDAAERSMMARFLEHPLAERTRICVRLWVAGGWWPDRPDPRVEPPRLMAPAPPRLALVRRQLIETLATLAPDAEYVVPGPREAAPRRSSSTRRGRDTRPNLQPLDSEGLTQRAALLGPLTWMGLAAMERPASSGPAVREGIACRASAAAAALRVDSVDAELAERHGRVVVQADFSIIAYPPLTAPELFALDSCAELEALDQTSRYRLSREALGRALQSGWTTDSMAARLRALTGSDLPDNVRVTLDDWSRHAERLRLTPNCRLLEVSDKRLLDALFADQTAAEWVERRLTPTAALLTVGSEAPVRAWLLRRGKLPALRSYEPPPGKSDAP